MVYSKLCFFKVKTPKITTIKQDTGMTAKDLVPETQSEDPESPLYGGLDDETLTKKKGKSALKVPRGSLGGGYNPLTF